MKLRLRSLESNQTQKIEFPNTSNLLQLKQFIILQLFPSQSSTLLPNNLHLSLNKKDELFASLPLQSIVSLGLTSGDLLYFTLNPNLLSTQNAGLLGIDVRDGTHVDELGKLGNPNCDLVGLTEELGGPSDGNRVLGDTQMVGMSKLGNPSDDNCGLVNSQMGKAGFSDELGGYSDGNRGLSDTQIVGMSNLGNPSDDNCGLVNSQMGKAGFSDELGGSSDGNRGLSDTQMVGMSKSGNPSDDNCGLVNSQMGIAGVSDGMVGCSDERRVLSDTQMEGMSNLSNPGDDNCDLVNDQGVKSSEFVGSGDGNRVFEEGMSKLSNASDHIEAQLMESEKSVEEDTLDARARGLADDTMEGDGFDEMEVDDESLSNVNTRFSVPGFLKNVYTKEVGDAAANGGNRKLLVIAVHAVLLEAGFVGYDPVVGRKIDRFHLSDEWPSSSRGISLHYTLPEISSSEVVETVVVKFQALGKFVNVYGSLDSFSKKGYGTHKICLDEPRLIPALSHVWKDSDATDSENKRIFEFWKIVKDGLSYPLLIELCEQAGLLPPPCFMLLPTELKLKILETLPGTDVAKVACVSSELNFVASNNDLWKLKYEEEFGDITASQRAIQWKGKFGSAWDIRKKKKRVCVPLQWREPPHFRPLFPGRRDPNPLGIPFIFPGRRDPNPLIPFNWW